MSDPSVKFYAAQNNEHERLSSMLGMEYAILLDGNITGGQLSVIEGYGLTDVATPWHTHGNDDEAVVVLDGQATVLWGEDPDNPTERHVLTQGGLVYMPRKVPHAVRCDIHSRILIINTPGGLQELVFRGAGWDLSQGPKPDGWQASVESLYEAGMAAGNTVNAPPPGRDA